MERKCIFLKAKIHSNINLNFNHHQMKRIKLTLDSCCSLNLEPEKITQYTPHWKGGCRVVAQINGRPNVFFVEESMDQITRKILTEGVTA
jgi:hypothetical protein